MKLKLKSDNFIHLKEKSKYNCNYYKHKNKDIIIEEICREDDAFNEYTLVDSELKAIFFLGCCSCSNAEGLSEGEIELDFMEFYT